MWVPVRFCWGVCVGWRIRAAWVTRRRPAELRSWEFWVSWRVLRKGETTYRMRGEENKILRKHRAPDYSGENPYPRLRDGCRTCTE